MLRGEMSQQELGDKLFIDRTIVSKIENGHIMPDEDLVNRWIEVTYDRWKRMKMMQAMFMEVQGIVQKAQMGA